MIYLKAYTEKDYSLVYQTENQLFNQMSDVEFHAHYLDNPLISIHMIEDGYKTVGYIVIWLDEDKSQIYTMVIFEPYRRQGFGYTALMLMEMMLKEKHVHQWSLEVRESNVAAIELYKKIGFKEVTKRYDYYDNHEHALLMLKII